MVRKFESTTFWGTSKNRVEADVIILGCSLPGIVTAHKLKKRFGNTMDIVVLNLAGPDKKASKCNVSFQAVSDDEDSDTEEDVTNYDETARQLLDNVARYYLSQYAKEFHLPVPDAIIAPFKVRQPLNKLFQHMNGTTVECATDFHDFEYLCLLERFEINQYQTLLDQSMMELFQTFSVEEPADRGRLMYYDRTTMEEHICGALFFTTSRDIMRMTVRLVCGASADSVSVLFYLHQCYRTSSSRNHLDGNNTRLREKLLGYCRKRFANRLQQSVADITFNSKPIKEIRTCSDEQVILETMKGETTYVCTLLAMALKPDELHNINVDDQLLSQENVKVTNSMLPGRAKKFLVQYEDNFWEKQGYSGDILSIRGPILWAMERPKMCGPGSTERYSALVGYLMVDENDELGSGEKVLDQLVKLFGEEAATPVSYRETDVDDVFIPKCGDFVALRRLTGKNITSQYVEWGALDIFAEGDVAAALEAGHTAYIHLLSYLRPQAVTYEDECTSGWPLFLSDNPLSRWLSNVNLVVGIKWSAYIAATIVTVRLVRSYLAK
ncbi:Amine oxidase (Flavin-containing) [Operophtera brumata]|uniref:monoamine oxidase n=1 Tax=Operophtera brumata TaxID=104452 RepID=A0A0L7LI09_OPEBR|nr:Amine oxidase (Flavin-containing) [Operophtera brumata]